VLGGLGMCQGNWGHISGVEDMSVGEGMCLRGLIVSNRRKYRKYSGHT